MRRIVGLFLVCLLVLGGFCPAAFAAEKPEVAAVRVAAHDGVTRFVMELSDHITFQVGQVAGQVSIDLPDLDWSQSGKKGMGKPVGVLRNWSYGPAGGGKGRILFETDGQAGVKKAFIMPPNDEGNYRLVIDLSADAPSPPPSPPVAAAEQPRIQLHRPGQPAVATPPSPPVTQASAPKVMAMTTGNPILTSVETPSQPVADSKTADDSDSEDAADAPKPAEEPVAATTSGVLKHPAGGTKVAAGPMPPPVPPPARPVPQPASVTTTEPPAAPSKVPNAKPVVVIDPGHGGIDRGGIPGVRLSEKDLTLDTAKRLSRILRANSGIKVVMTRNEDTFVSLGARTAIANRYARANAVFVSIHYNVGLREGAYGIETYYNNRGAYRLAVLIHSRVIQAADSIDRGIRHRGYRVLRANRLPAILIECGFMTNRAEAARIQSARYRDRIAKAIADGLLE